MKPTRTTQPYRKGPRVPSDALRAMLKGRTAGGHNPADITRMAAKLSGARKKRNERPPRPARPPRPPR